MKTIFLARDSAKIFEVYNDQTLNELRSISDINSSKVYTKSMVELNKDLIKNVEYIFSTWYMPSFSEQEIAKYFPNLKAIFYAAGTVKYFAEPFLNSGVRIFHAAAANGIPVAEFVVAQIILANKGYFQAQSAYKEGWYKNSFKKGYKFAKKKTGNYNSSVGIIGVGNVGTKVIELLKPYKINLKVYDPFISQEKAKRLNCEVVSLERLFSDCKVISNHLPDTDKTKGMITYSLLSRMEETATFINTGRGAQVVEKDLIRILKKRPNMCALLDVTKHEPILPFNQLYRLKNVFITPHISGSMNNEQHRMADYMLHAYKDYINGKQSSYEVTKEMLNQLG